MDEVESGAVATLCVQLTMQVPRYTACKKEQCFLLHRHQLNRLKVLFQFPKATTLRRNKTPEPTFLLTGCIHWVPVVLYKTSGTPFSIYTCLIDAETFVARWKYDRPNQDIEIRERDFTIFHLDEDENTQAF